VAPRLGSASPTARKGGRASRQWRFSSVARRVGRWAVASLPLLAMVVVDDGLAGAHSPHDDVADVAISPDYRDDHTVFAIVRSRLMRSTDGGSTWSEIVQGLGDESQASARVAIAPSDPDVMYLTTHGGGVLRSDDGGTSWQPAAGGLTNLTLQEIAVSPTSPQIVLVAGAIPGGLFLTTDGGASWSSVLGSQRVTAMTFLPGDSAVLVGDAQGQIVTSPDGGRTWDSPRVLAKGDSVTAVVAGAAPEAAVVYVATASGRLFRSDDGARSFTELGDGLPAEEVRSLELSPHYADDAALWASTWHSGVFRSTDSGETWQRMTEGLTTDPQADHVRVPQFRAVAAAADGSGRPLLFVGGFDGLFRYDGDRNRWDPIETLTDYIVGLAVSPAFQDDTTIAVTTYVKGAFISEDGGERWRFANDGLTVDSLGPGNKYAPLRRLHNVTFSPDYADDGTIFSASWVRILKSTDRGASWKDIEVSPPRPGQELRQFVLAVSPSYASDHTVFAATRQGEVFRSEGGGDPGTWSQVGIFGERVRSLVVSPRYADDKVLYAGTVGGVYASSDGGRTWRAGPRMVAGSRSRETDPGALLAISPAYGRDGTVFAATDRGLRVTRDAGRSWTEVVAAPLTRSSRIEALAVSPDYQNDGTVLVSTRERGLLLSTDRGATFRQVGTELLAANHLVADFSNPTSAPIQFSPTFAADRTVFAYAQTHVVRSTDRGESWQLLELPPATDVLESLRAGLGANYATAANGHERRWFETPIGNLSMRRVLVAAVVGMATFVVLTTLRVGGRSRRRALALRLGGGVTLLAVTLLLLAK
jgi:photosystem II stability/assembly factor-like uncharacterized protein